MNIIAGGQSVINDVEDELAVKLTLRDVAVGCVILKPVGSNNILRMFE